MAFDRVNRGSMIVHNYRMSSKIYRKNRSMLQLIKLLEFAPPHVISFNINGSKEKDKSITKSMRFFSN